MFSDTLVTLRNHVLVDPTQAYLLIASISDMSSYIIDKTCSYRITGPTIVGRSDSADCQFKNGFVSKSHCLIHFDKKRWIIRDLGSTNGTFLNGIRVEKKKSLQEGDILRIGDVVSAFHKRSPIPNFDHTYPGGVHHASEIAMSLHRAAKTNQNILVTGESGVGKELAAEYLMKLWSFPTIVVHNAPDYGSEDEAMASLFGVAHGSFTGVSARQGALSMAQNGALFIDEIHRYPRRIQSSLLRVMETGIYRPVGSSSLHRFTGRIVCASNAPPPDYGLIPDLYNRLFHVSIPSLRERKADIPTIFQSLLCEACDKAGLPSIRILKAVGTDECESLCLKNWTGVNVRGLSKLVNAVVADVLAGDSPENAVCVNFLIHMSRNKTYSPSDELNEIRKVPCQKARSKFERHRNVIEAIYREQNGNIAATARELHKVGITLSNRWLSVYVKKWDIKL